jgi:hypothetical protein
MSFRFIFPITFKQMIVAIIVIVVFMIVVVLKNVVQSNEKFDEFLGPNSS